MKIKSIFFLFIIVKTLSVESQASAPSDTTSGDINDKHNWGFIPAPTFNFDYVGAAQTYWKYRYRLVGDFITPDSTAKMGEPGFMILGEGDVGSGFSSVAQTRNAVGNGNWIFISGTGFTGYCTNQNIGNLANVNGYLNWSDGQGNELGKYLAVLATEWELLSNNQLLSVTSNETQWELYYAMKSLNRLEQTAYQEDGILSAPPNGIFYRDDAPQTLAQTTFPAGSQPPYNPYYPYKCFGSNYDRISSQYSCSNFGCPDHTGSNYGMMSIDQAVKMIWGLAFVIHSIHHNDIVINGYDIHDEAEGAMQRIIGWIQSQNNFSNFPHQWHIKDPLGNDVCQGSAAGLEAAPLVDIDKFYTTTNIADVYSTTQGAQVWTGTFDEGLFWTGGTQPIPVGSGNNGEYLLELGILAGDDPWRAGIFGNPFFAMASTVGAPLARHYWQKCIAQEGNSINWPYMDLASAYLNSYRPHFSAADYQTYLTNPGPTTPYENLYYPYCWPCEMPLFDYTVAEGTPALLYQTPYLDPLRRGLPGEVGNPNDQYTGLDYMLFYNLYCLFYGSNYLDAATGNQSTFSDLKDRIVTASYPLTISGTSLGGSASQHLYIGAETSMTFNGSVANSGTYIDFQAPHLGSHPLPFDNTPNGNIWVKYGAVCTFTNGRPPCGSAMVPGTSIEYSSAYDPDSDDSLVTPEMLQMVAMMQKHLLDSLSNSTYTADSSLQDVNFALNVYPNPLSSQCTISLSLPTDARASMEVDDAYGRLVSTVLGETNLSAGDHDYLFDRGSLADGTYLLIIYVNGKPFTRKLIVI